uniref:Alkaline exonuclease n=1 Tax=Bovine herpesvirus 4 TaxID=10385 RepID=A0A0F6N4S1_BHV4|nr:alkaline exonuclease [Bovine gammaherpesvirus 4]QJC19166.1 alkaline exonuclease [Bovine gammaherpesvirus 4]WEM32502.1 alkaline exonuclease [Bovine gammaherpesvirus 4]
MTMASPVDFFDSQPLLDEMDTIDLDAQSRKITEFTFSSFLGHSRIQQFMSTCNVIPRMPAMRYMYFYYLFKKIGEFIGNNDIVKFYEDKVFDKYNPPGSIYEVYMACHHMDFYKQYAICLLLESITREQHLSTLWDTLRNGIISSSKMHWVIKQRKTSKKIFEPWPIKNNYYVASPLAFGLRCEGIVKSILINIIYPNTPNCIDYGFMQSPLDGIFGVSLDFCTNISHDENGMLIFEPDCCVYEIKCRFKYMFSKSECDPLYGKYVSLYQNPNKKNLINFILSVSRPAVEFVAPGGIPSEHDFLLTHGLEWRWEPPKRKRTVKSTNWIIECIKYNSCVESDVFILSDPSITNGNITIKSHFKADLFVNPKHTYFFQVLLQYKVVESYIQFSPSTKTLGSQKNFIVSAFFRKRNFKDPLTCTLGDTREVLKETVEIPVMIIITQVRIPKFILKENMRKATTYWADCSEKTFTHSPWVTGLHLAVGKSMTP